MKKVLPSRLGEVLAYLFMVGFLYLSPSHTYASDGGFPVNYVIDRQNSRIRIFVYRKGLFEILGHDHLISTQVIDGSLSYHPSNSPAAVFRLNLPVEGFEVDDPQQRKMAGGKFSDALSEEARTGTRRNMLSDKVLDVVNYSEISIDGHSIKGSLPRDEVKVTIVLHGRQQNYSVPVEVRIKNDELVATGELHPFLTQFDIKPLSILGGLLQVADGIDIDFTLAFKSIENTVREDSK